MYFVDIQWILIGSTSIKKKKIWSLTTVVKTRGTQNFDMIRRKFLQTALKQEYGGGVQLAWHMRKPAVEEYGNKHDEILF